MKQEGEDESIIQLEKAYRNALRKAWEDGRISYDERSLIKQFTDDLPLPKEVLSVIEAREYLRFRWKEYETSSYDHQMNVVEKLLDIDEENPFLWMKKGSLQFLMGDMHVAFEALDRGLELDPTSHEAWFWKGSAFVNEGDLGVAQDCFEKALEQDPDHTLSWLMLGRVERRQGNLEKAKACSTRAIECCPEHPIGYVERALTLLEIGSKEEARLDLEKVLDIDPLNEIALTYMKEEIGPRPGDDEDLWEEETEKEEETPQKIASREEENDLQEPTSEEEDTETDQVDQPEDQEEATPSKEEEIQEETSMEDYNEEDMELLEEDEFEEDDQLSGEGQEETITKKEIVQEDVSEIDIDENPEIDGEEHIVKGKKKKGSYLDDDMFEDRGGKEETLETDIEEDEAEIVQKMIKCPHCDGPVPVTTDKRPVVVICPSCGSKGRLVR